MELQHQHSNISHLIRKFESIGYEYFDVKSEDDLVANLRRQIESVNQTTFSDVDFVKVMGHVSILERDVDSAQGSDYLEVQRNCGATMLVHLLNRSEMKKNKFQFARKLFGKNEKADPYEVVLYVNGLPFANVNLKNMDYLVSSSSKKINSYSTVSNL